MIIDPRFLYPKTDPGASVQHNLVMIQSLAQVRNQTSVKCPGTHTSLFERAISSWPSLLSLSVEWLPLLKAFSLCLSRIPCSGLRGPKHSEDKEGNEVKPIQCKASSLIEYSSVEYGTRGPTRKALPAYHFEFQGASLGGSLMDMGGQSTLPGLITDTPRNQCGLVEARESERRKPAYSFFSSSSYPIMYYQDKGRWHNAALTDVSDCSFMQCITGGPQ
ncbi:hypothetical protein Salat_2992300 [Sesamum alatum]|uniref:Uncharacterized protein n=1 Tax=Sesamum alatum TaxID=300844 RepID=A0AAE1XHT7_9LAMI|nr:hypothetical protein Salat_2992300 [Sesamum alatum]